MADALMLGGLMGLMLGGLMLGGLMFGGLMFGGLMLGGLMLGGLMFGGLMFGGLMGLMLDIEFYDAFAAVHNPARITTPPAPSVPYPAPTKNPASVRCCICIVIVDDSHQTVTSWR